MKKLIKNIKKARFVWVCGNGGSSATAEHLTNDLFSKGIKAICLNSNNAIMTMIANDFGYEHTFSRQLILMGEKEDMLITISCSGTSPNIRDVQEVAKKKQMSMFAFKDFSETGLKNYEKLEDDHMKLVHQIKKAL